MYLKVKHLSFDDSFTIADISKTIGPHKSLCLKIGKVKGGVVGLTAAERKNILKMIKFMTNIDDINFYKGLTKEKLVTRRW